MKRPIIVNSTLLFIDYLPSESDEMFYDRINFIINVTNNKLKKNKDINYIINLSKIYSNVKYKKVSYDNSIMQELSELLN
jgi:hypothetical protein